MTLPGPCSLLPGGATMVGLDGPRPLLEVPAGALPEDAALASKVGTLSPSDPMTPLSFYPLDRLCCQTRSDRVFQTNNGYRYSPNIHNEDVVYAQYVLENYHDLPNHTVFVHPKPQVRA